MSQRLGSKQLNLLSGMVGVGTCLVVPCPVSRSLCTRGFMEPTGTTPASADGMIVVTAAGLRAVADAIDAGTVKHRPDWDAIRQARKTNE